MPALKESERLVEILLLLAKSREALSIRAIGDHFFVQQGVVIPLRALQRDMQRLSSIIDDMQVDGDRHTGFAYRLNTTGGALGHIGQRMQQRHCRSATALMDLARVLEGTSLVNDAASIAAALSDECSSGPRSSASRAPQEILEIRTIGKLSWSTRRDLFDPIVTALIDRRRLRLVYGRAGQEPSERLVIPVRLSLWKGQAYLIAFDENDSRIKVYLIPRVESAAVDSACAVRSGDLLKALAEYESRRFGIYADDAPPEQVVLSFDAGFAYQIDGRIWHPSQRISRGEDGSLNLTMTVSAGEELMSWIFSWQHYVEVLEPQWLREEIASRVQQIAKTYSTTP